MRALVTGGAGFIGSNLVEALLQRGDAVRVLDNLSTGHRSNLDAVGGDVDLVEGDLRSYERVSRAVRGCEVVFHEGALPSVPRSVQDPMTTNEVNVGGTLNVLLAARDAGVRRVVFASSSSVYGDLPGLPRREAAPVSPAAPYAVSKLAAEHYCLVSSRVYGLQAVALRYFNVFGDRQDPTSHYSAVIPKFIAALAAGRPPLVHGAGNQSRDFTYIANVVAANLLAAEAPDADGQAFNVATGEQQSLLAMIATLNDIMGTAIAPEHGPPRSGDVDQSWADITRAREHLGYAPSVGFEDGLRRTVAYYEREGRGLASRTA